MARVVVVVLLLLLLLVLGTYRLSSKFPKLVQIALQTFKIDMEDL